MDRRAAASLVSPFPFFSRFVLMKRFCPPSPCLWSLCCNSSGKQTLGATRALAAQIHTPACRTAVKAAARTDPNDQTKQFTNAFSLLSAHKLHECDLLTHHHKGHTAHCNTLHLHGFRRAILSRVGRGAGFSITIRQSVHIDAIVCVRACVQICGACLRNVTYAGPICFFHPHIKHTSPFINL